MATVRDAVLAAERDARVLQGADERFSGWGLMGLTFRSGDVLAARCFPASSVGPGYTSVWHRDPAGLWTFYADVPAEMACSRFFGNAVDRSVACSIALEWIDEATLRIEVPDARLSSEVTVGTTWASRAMNLMSMAFPEWAWRSPRALRMAATLAGPLLGAGKLAMAGTAPNGQSFIANPRTIWVVQVARLSVDGRDAGEPAPLERQAQLGDFCIPQRGLLAVGNTAFDAFNPKVHSSRTTAS